MPASAEEILALQHLKSRHLVTDEEHQLLRRYLEERPEGEAARQLRDLHQSLEAGDITAATHQDIKARILRRVHTELKTPELKMLEPEEPEPPAPVASRPRTPLPLVALALLVVIAVVTVPLLARQQPREDRQVVAFLQAMRLGPSGQLPLQDFRQPDGQYRFEYRQTRLGGQAFLEWTSPDTWNLRVVQPSMEPDDLGPAQGEPRSSEQGTISVHQSSMGLLQVEQPAGGDELRIQPAGQP